MLNISNQYFKYFSVTHSKSCQVFFTVCLWTSSYFSKILCSLSKRIAFCRIPPSLQPCHLYPCPHPSCRHFPTQVSPHRCGGKVTQLHFLLDFCFQICFTSCSSETQKQNCKLGIEPWHKTWQFSLVITVGGLNINSFIRFIQLYCDH